MDLVTVTRWIAAGGLLIAAAGLLLRMNEIMRRPFKNDLSRPRGNVRRGILYAFTLGMAPWEKESTRIHWVAYLRGIAFHVGIFLAFGALFASPWLAAFPPALRWMAAVVTGLGAAAGFAGLPMRWMEANTRKLSLPDDYFSVFLTALFIALASAALLVPVALPAFYVVTAVMSVYVPFSKIRHCMYFFYSKFIFGRGYGHRGVIGQAKSKYAE
jgi:hypothetical protein